MAHKDTVQDDELKRILSGNDIYWNLTASVGYACKNRTADVMLVQFFLNHMYLGDYEEWVKVDGRFGGKTWAAIKEFQRSYSCVIDGAVRPADGKRLHTPKQGKIYTIYQLNSVVAQHYPPPVFKDIRVIKGIPGALSIEVGTVAAI